MTLAARIFSRLSAAPLTRAELAAAERVELREVDAALSRLVVDRLVWPESPGGTVVWALTAAGRVAAEAKAGG